MKTRSLTLMGAACTAGALALAAPAWAEEAAASSAADNMIVVRDAETGQLRAPTAEEGAALTAARTANTRVSAAKASVRVVKRHVNGAVGMRATDDMASYSVVTKRADGTLAQACVESKSEAEQAVQSGLLPAQQQAVEK